MPRRCSTACVPKSSYRWTIVSVSLVGAEDVAAPRRAAGPELPVVVDLAVEDDPDRSVLVRHRLLAVLEIDDAQPPHAEADALAEIDALVVGPAMHHRAAHGADCRARAQGGRPSGRFRRCHTRSMFLAGISRRRRQAAWDSAGNVGCRSARSHHDESHHIVARRSGVHGSGGDNGRGRAAMRRLDSPRKPGWRRSPRRSPTTARRSHGRISPRPTFSSRAIRTTPTAFTTLVRQKRHQHGARQPERRHEPADRDDDEREPDRCS